MTGISPNGRDGEAEGDPVGHGDGGPATNSRDGSGSGNTPTDLRMDLVTTSSCSFSPAAPSIEFQATCASYRAGTLEFGVQVALVELSISGPPGNRAVMHRFRSLSSCGYDMVITLPNLRLAVDDQPYDISKWWWSASDGGSALVAVVLWRGQPMVEALAVAVPGHVDELAFLIDPLVVSQRGPPCTAPAQTGNASQVLDKDGAPLSCEDEEGGVGLRLCQDDATTYRIVAYPGATDTTSAPAVFGLSALLLPAD
jgi:hypothetical protein